MSEAQVRPFDSIEDTQEFLALFQDAIEQATGEVTIEAERSRHVGELRRAEAFTLAQFKLAQLSDHAKRSRRIVNDLRLIRRLLASERLG